MQEINTDIIIEQIESIVERAIAENEAVLISLGVEERKIGEDGELDLTKEVQKDGFDNRAFLQVAN